MPRAALRNGRGLIGLVTPSPFEGWTTIPTAKFPAMRTEEFSIVLQVPPLSGIPANVWGQVPEYQGWEEMRDLGHGRSHMLDIGPTIWGVETKSGLRSVRHSNISQGSLYITVP